MGIKFAPSLLCCERQLCSLCILRQHGPAELALTHVFASAQPLENITPLVLQPTLLNSKPLHTQILDKVGLCSLVLQDPAVSIRSEPCKQAFWGRQSVTKLSIQGFHGRSMSVPSRTDVDHPSCGGTVTVDRFAFRARALPGGYATRELRIS